jgi:hypothetical protein
MSLSLLAAVSQEFCSISGCMAGVCKLKLVAACLSAQTSALFVTSSCAWLHLEEVLMLLSVIMF